MKLSIASVDGEKIDIFEIRYLGSVSRTTMKKVVQNERNTEYNVAFQISNPFRRAADLNLSWAILGIPFRGFYIISGTVWVQNEIEMVQKAEPVLFKIHTGGLPTYRT